MKGYANPPWNLIARTLRKTQEQGAEIILVAPVWKTQPWYPLLLAMLADWPRLLPKQTINTEVGHLHPQLAVWSISGKAFAVKAFQTKLQNWSLAHGDQILRLTLWVMESLV